MRIFIYAGLILLSAVLETTVFTQVNIAGIRPDTMLCLIVSLALLQGSFVGMFTGLAGGLTLDIMAGDILGYYALIYTLMGFLCALLNNRPGARSFALPVALSIICYVLMQALQMTILYFMDIDFAFWHTLLRYVVPSAVFTAVWMLLTHVCMRKLCASPIMHPYNARDSF